MEMIHRAQGYIYIEQCQLGMVFTFSRGWGKKSKEE